MPLYAIVLTHMANSYAFSSQLKKDVTRGKELQARLLDGNGGESDVLGLWQFWEERVIAHLKLEDRKTFVSLKSTLGCQIEPLACLAACLARELEWLENLLKS